MAKQNFNYNKVYTAGWKDAMEEMREKLDDVKKENEQLRTMLLLYIDRKNTERKTVYDALTNEEWYKRLDRVTQMEVLDAATRAIRGEEPREYNPTVKDIPLDSDDFDY